MEITNRHRLEDLKEKILTVAVFTGIFLPARLLFYNYISDYWLGSFGLITGILLTMMYLAKKNKLGYLGRIVNRQILSFSKGRYGKFAMFNLVFFIYLFSLAIYGIDNYSETMKDGIMNRLAEEGVTDMASLNEQAETLRFTGPGVDLIPFFSIVIMLVPNNLGYVMYSIVNDFTDGWFLHFSTVFLIEHLEALGLVVYFRYVHR